MKKIKNAIKFVLTVLVSITVLINQKTSIIEYLINKNILSAHDGQVLIIPLSYYTTHLKIASIVILVIVLFYCLYLLRSFLKGHEVDSVSVFYSYVCALCLMLWIYPLKALSEPNSIINFIGISLFIFLALYVTYILIVATYKSIFDN